MKILCIGNKSFDCSLFTLSFSGKLEKDYLNTYFKKSLWHARISLLLAIFIYSIFGIVINPLKIRNTAWSLQGC